MSNRTIALQKYLAAAGTYKGKIDGIDGPGTKKALIDLQVIRGGCARRIDKIVVHCTATAEGQSVSVETIRGWHKAKGWSDIGYHWVTLLDGKVAAGRPEKLSGAHVEGANSNTIGIVYVGGVAKDGRTPKDTRTADQKNGLRNKLIGLAHTYPGAEICGHRDYSPDLNGNGVIEPFEWMKACPSFDAPAEYAFLQAVLS